MTKKKSNLTAEDLQRICRTIGKKGADGKPITKEEIEKWPSVKGGK